MLITSKDDLKCYIAADNNILIPNGLKGKMIADFASYPTQSLKKYMYYLRKQEYYINTAKGNKLKGLLGLIYERRKNRLGMRLGIEIAPNCFGKGLSIWHIGSIIVNSEAKIGDNCILHGANCIGNNGKTQAAPRIGNNVDIGYGAVIIGDIEIADNVKIGANAVVNKSVTKQGCTVVGIPAQTVCKK